MESAGGGTMDITHMSSNKDGSSPSQSSSSPFSKLSGQIGSDYYLPTTNATRASSDSGGCQQQPRNSKTTEAEILDSSSRTGDVQLRGPPSARARAKRDRRGHAPKQPMVPYTKLWSFATPLDFTLIAIGASAAIAHGAVLPIGFALLGRVVDALGSNKYNVEVAFQKICQISLIFVYIAVVSIWINWLEVTCWIYTGERQTVEIRKRYLKALLSRDMTFFDTELTNLNNNVDAVTALSNDMVSIHEAIGEKVASFLLNISTFVAGIVVAFLQCWEVAFLTLCTVPLLVGTGITYGRIYTKLLVKAQASIAAASSIAMEAISQVRTVYSVVGESRTVGAFSQALWTAAKLGIKGSLAKGVGMGAYFGIINFTWAAALLYGGVLVRKGKTDGGAVLATMFSIIHGGMALGQTVPELQVFVRGRIAGFKVFKIIDHEICRDPSHGETLAVVRGEIEFCSVHFSYPSRPTMPVISDMSLTVHAGETVALVGSRSSGRSTVLMLIQRLYSPNFGAVLLDGSDIRTFQRRWLRRHIGFASQEPVVFSGTIRQNILFGKPEGSAADVEAAAIAVNAHSFISKLPFGYETVVGESGIRLSVPQKQRLALARAIVNNPEILLLDEAMSSLEAQSELLVNQALHTTMQDRTIITVTHRISTARNADIILALDHGTIIERGSHAQLLERGPVGLYASLLRLQEIKSVKQDDGNASAVANPLRTTSNSVGSSPPRSSFHSGTTSPIASLLQSPVTPSSRILELQNDSNPESPFILELPPSPATPPGLMHEDSESIIKCPRVDEQSALVDHLPPNVTHASMCKLLPLEWLSTTLGSLAAITTGCINPIVTLLLMNVIELFYSSNKQMISGRGSTWCIVIAGIGLVNIGTGIVQHFSFGKAGENTTKFTREKAFKAIMTNEVGWFDFERHSRSVLTSRIGSCGTVMSVAFSDRVPMCLQYFTSVGVAITLAFVIQWKIAAVLVILIPFTVVGGYMKTTFAREGFAGSLEKSHRTATRLAGEAISNIRTVAVFCMEEQVICQLQECLRVSLRKEAWRAHRGGLIFGISQAGMHAANALSLWYLAVMVRNNHSQPWPGLKVYQIVACMGFLLAETFRFVPDMREGVAATKLLLEVTNRPTEIDPDSPDGLPPSEVAGHVEFQNVTFCYPARPLAVVLNDINLVVPAGHTIGLVGPSGSGKSTIISLLERFYDPLFGRILLDGFDLKTLNLKWVRKHIGLVQQEPALFALSIRDNIMFGNENMSEADMIEAARKANAHGFISSLPEAYDTRVGEQEVHLSSGQKQRIAIARAVIQNPRILLLDDATNCLDSESEKVVQDALDNIMLEGERRTTILITHRFTNIQRADMIVYMKNGQITEKGSHSLLMEHNGAYSKLVHAQNSTFFWNK